MDLGDVLDLVVDVDSNLSDNWGGDYMLTDLVDRDNGLMDGVVNCGHRGGSVGSSRGSSVGHSRGSSVGGSWGSNDSGRIRSSSYSSKSGVANSSKTRVSSSKSRVSNSTKTGVSSKASISGAKELAISISCRASKGGSHEGRQSN